MYSLFVRGNIGAQFHKVEQRLESVISSRALFFSQGRSTAFVVLIVIMKHFHVRDKCCVLWKIKPISYFNYK